MVHIDWVHDALGNQKYMTLARGKALQLLVDFQAWADANHLPFLHQNSYYTNYRVQYVVPAALSTLLNDSQYSGSSAGSDSSFDMC